MPDLPNLYADFASHDIEIDGLRFHARSGGSGPALLCLHGYPQSHVCWHRLAPRLTHATTVVALDLRGYGLSSAPPGDASHVTYSKRTMAKDCVAVMRALGHDRFHVMGHDRGGRVAYRLALDTPDAVQRLILLDIIPDRRAVGFDRRRSRHRVLPLAVPGPAETVAGNPDRGERPVLSRQDTGGLDQGQDPRRFRSRCIGSLSRALCRPSAHSRICEDYRAGATFDRTVDSQDRDAGRRIAAKALVLWGSHYLGRSKNSPLDIWRRWCEDVDGAEIESGHFLAEENPDATAKAILGFLDGA